MSCTVIMDLKPEGDFTLSTSKKSATLKCGFSGSYKSDRTAEIELMITRRTSYGKELKSYIKELNDQIKTGNLFRVMGQLRYLRYQDRSSGIEMQKYQLVADSISPSNAVKPIFSNVVMEGGVRFASTTEFFKDTGKTRKVVFWTFSDPGSDYDKEAFLSLPVVGFGEVADKTYRMKLREKSHVIASGRLEASDIGSISLMLYELNYNNGQKKVKEN